MFRINNDQFGRYMLIDKIDNFLAVIRKDLIIHRWLIPLLCMKSGLHINYNACLLCMIFLIIMFVFLSFH